MMKRELVEGDYALLNRDRPKGRRWLRQAGAILLFVAIIQVGGILGDFKAPLAAVIDDKIECGDRRDYGGDQVNVVSEPIKNSAHRGAAFVIGVVLLICLIETYSYIRRERKK